MEKIKEYLKQRIIFLLKILYSWMTNELEPLGYILGVIHIAVCVTIILMVIVSHTLYPAFWLQCVMFVIVFIIWLQHIFLKICVVFAAEYVLTKSESPLYTLINFFTSLEPQDWTIHFMVAETMAVCMLGLSLIGRFSLAIHEIYKIQM
jgi:hypothetical protein